MENKLTPIKLSISKEEFIEKISFDIPDDEIECKKYLDLKGIAYYVKIANAVNKSELSCAEIQYSKIRDFFIYDKRLRKVLFVYLSAFEEQIRAQIINKYKEKNDFFIFSKKNNEKNKEMIERIQKKLLEKKSLVEYVEDLTLGELIFAILERDDKDDFLSEIFKGGIKSKGNILAINKLRNIVFHNRIILLDDTLFEITEISQNTDDNKLKLNILNLLYFISSHFRKKMRLDINNAIKKGDNVDNNKLNVPSGYIIELREDEIKNLENKFKPTGCRK